MEQDPQAGSPKRSLEDISADEQPEAKKICLEETDQESIVKLPVEEILDSNPPPAIPVTDESIIERSTNVQQTLEVNNETNVIQNEENKVVIQSVIPTPLTLTPSETIPKIEASSMPLDAKSDQMTPEKHGETGIPSDEKIMQNNEEVPIAEESVEQTVVDSIPIETKVSNDTVPQSLPIEPVPDSNVESKPCPSLSFIESVSNEVTPDAVQSATEKVPQDSATVSMDQECSEEKPAASEVSENCDLGIAGSEIEEDSRGEIPPIVLSKEKILPEPVEPIETSPVIEEPSAASPGNDSKLDVVESNTEKTVDIPIPVKSISSTDDKIEAPILPENLEVPLPEPMEVDTPTKDRVLQKDPGVESMETEETIPESEQVAPIVAVDETSNSMGPTTPTDMKDGGPVDPKTALDLRASLLASRVGELCANTDSPLNTPGDSSENSTGLSTPIGSYQDSAAPSPKHFEVISKEAMLNFANSGQSTPITSKKPPKKKKGKSKRVSKPVVVDEETRMDAITVNSVPEITTFNEDSQSSTGTSSKKEVRRFRCEVIVPESTEDFTVEKVIEYIWPLEGMGEHYFIQEHMSQYLGIMSFKRKYPDLRRRPIESQEKEYLRDHKIVSEMACDLGLTAVRSEDVLDVMFNDFPHKYEELTKALRDRKEKKLKEESRLEYQVVDLDKSRMHEYSKKAAKGAAKWNAMFNKERQEERRYAFDMQTFTLHYQLGRCKKLPAEMTKKGSYPVTVLPGQYADYYKEYNALELRAMPLNSVLYGPFTAEELEEPPVESEEDSASAGTAVEEKEVIPEPVEVSAPVTIDPLSAEKLPRCKVCNGGRDRNKVGRPEPLIICGSCRTPSHPTCIDLTLAMVGKIESYGWQCMECKTCAQCNDPDDEERMIFCDMCDRGYHIYCVGLRKVPNGRWHCKVCAHCFSCGSRAPSGNESIKNAEWQHEFRKEKADKKELKYACTLCVPCDKYWKRRQFCHVCLKVYKSIPEDHMIRCSGCPKYVHRDGGCSTQQDNERYCANCMKGRRKTALNHSRILAAAKKKMASGF